MDLTQTPPPEAPPKWLSEEYFRSLFRRKSPGEEVTVKNVTVKFADEERLHGKLIRAVVDVDTPSGAKSFSYVIKTPGPGDFSTTPSCTNIYRMESLMLGKVIPAMEKVLDAIAPGKYGQLAPRLVDYSIDGNRFIMTEDLTVHGFSTVSRQKGLDLEHSLAFAKHLAAFHAASVAILDLHESEIASIPLLTDSEESKYLNSFIENSMKGVVSALASQSDLLSYEGQVRKLGATLPARLAEANRRRSEVLTVVCHGDMFVNNILFRHEHGEVAGVRLVDFQLSRVGSFADDLLIFLLSAVSNDVLEHHFERVIDAYSVALNDALSALGFGSRTLSQAALREELHAQRAVAQFAVFHMLPHSRTATAVDLSGNCAFVAASYTELLRLLLPRLRALGWLDESLEITETGKTLEIYSSTLQNKCYIHYLLLCVCLTILSTVEETRDTEILHLYLKTSEQLPGTAISQQKSNKTTIPVLDPAITETNSHIQKKCQPYVNVRKSSTNASMLKMDAPMAHVASKNREDIFASFKNCEPIKSHSLVHSDNITSYNSTEDLLNNIFQIKKSLENSDLKKYLELIQNLAFFHSTFMIALIQSLKNISNTTLSTVWRYWLDPMKIQMPGAYTSFPMQNKELLNTKKSVNLRYGFSEPLIHKNRHRNSKFEYENAPVNIIYFVSKKVASETNISETNSSENRHGDFNHKWSDCFSNNIHNISNSNIDVIQYNNTRKNIPNSNVDYSVSTSLLKDILTIILGISRQTCEITLEDFSKEYGVPTSAVLFDFIPLHFTKSIKNVKIRNKHSTIIHDTTIVDMTINAIHCCHLNQTEQFLPEFNFTNLIEV